MVKPTDSTLEIVTHSHLQRFVSQLPKDWMRKYFPQVNSESLVPKNINEVLNFLENLPVNRKDEFINIMLNKIKKPGFARNFDEIEKTLEILPTNLLRKQYIMDLELALKKAKVNLTVKQADHLHHLKTQFNEPPLKLITEIKAKTEVFMKEIRQEIIHEVISSSKLKKIFADALGLDARSFTKKQLKNNTEDLDRFIVSYIPNHNMDNTFKRIKIPAMQFQYAQELMQSMQESTPKKCIESAQKIFQNSNARDILEQGKKRGFWARIFNGLGFYSNKGIKYTRFFDKKIKVIEAHLKSPSPRNTG